MKEFFTLPKQIQLREVLKFISVLLGSAIFPFMAMYYVSHFGTFWTGILMVITQIVGFFATLYGGHLSDALGRKKVLDRGNFGMAIGFLIMTLSNIPGHVMPRMTFIGILLVEMMFNFSQPASEAMIIDLTDEGNRRYVYTISYWLINIAVMFGAGLAGIFYDHHFFEILLTMTVAGFLTFFVAHFKFEETKPMDMEFEHDSSVFATVKNYGQVFQDKIFLLYTLGTLLFKCVWLQVDNYIPIHFRTHFQQTTFFGIEMTGAKMLSLSVLINTVMIVLLMTSFGKWTKSMKLLPQLILGSTLFATGIFFTFTFTSLPMISMMVVLYTVGEMIQVPASQVLRAEMMDENKIGSYAGFLSMADPLGSILAGMMVSLSSFTGGVGVQVSFVLVASIGLYLTVKSARLHGMKE